MCVTSKRSSRLQVHGLSCVELQDVPGDGSGLAECRWRLENTGTVCGRVRQRREARTSGATSERPAVLNRGSF